MVQSNNPDSTSRYRTRRSFAKIPAVMDVPNLIAIQTESFKKFMDDGLTNAFADISPIESNTKDMCVEFAPSSSTAQSVLLYLSWSAALACTSLPSATKHPTRPSTTRRSFLLAVHGSSSKPTSAISFPYASTVSVSSLLRFFCVHSVSLKRVKRSSISSAIPRW